MGDVVRFRRAVLAGFIPDHVGVPTDCGEHLDKLATVIASERERLIQFAKTGAPPEPDEYA